MSDFRIKTEFFNHPKAQRLLRLLGADSVLSLIRLWSFAATTFPDGRLRDMDAKDIETAAGWSGKPGAFYKAITSEKMRFLDLPETDGGDHCLHDWEEHQPWVVNAPARRKQASRAATTRWGKDAGSNSSRNSIGANADSNAVSMPAAMPLSLPLLSLPNKISLSEVVNSGLPESRLTAKLIEKLRTNNVKVKIPSNLKKWTDAARHMMERDGRTLAEIEAVIEFSQRDDFWKTNILSMPKLREKFDQLYLKMQTPKKGAVLPFSANEPKRESAAAIAARTRSAQ